MLVGDHGQLSEPRPSLKSSHKQNSGGVNFLGMNNKGCDTIESRSYLKLKQTLSQFAVINLQLDNRKTHPENPLYGIRMQDLP